jgi:hypothetical protein
MRRARCRNPLPHDSETAAYLAGLPVAVIELTGTVMITGDQPPAAFGFAATHVAEAAAVHV